MLYDDFKPIVDLLLNNWTALQLAVDHGMGAPGGEKTAQLMAVYVARYCVENVVCIDDLAETLEDLMDEEFDTVCYDNSPREIATCLLNFLAMLKEGRHGEVQAQIAAMPPSQRWLSQPCHLSGNGPPQCGGNPDDDTSSSDDNEAPAQTPEWSQSLALGHQNGTNAQQPGGFDLSLNPANAQASTSQDEPMDDGEPSEPGWTVVRARRKN